MYYLFTITIVHWSLHFQILSEFRISMIDLVNLTITIESGTRDLRVLRSLGLWL